MERNDFHARHLGLFEPSVLDDKRVLIVGAGSVGSIAASLLVRAGVKFLRVADFDIVSTSNICRTAYLARDIGRPKVEALAERLTEVRPEIEVDARAVDLRQVRDPELISWIDNADVVIAATDHPPTQARLGALSYARVPAVFIGIYAKGTGGEVVFTLPNTTPCYDCILGQVRGDRGPNRGSLDYGLTTGQLKAEPALGLDIAHVTACGAKIALALLLRESGANITSIIDPTRSVLFVGNAVDWIWTEPFETVWARAERKAACVCRGTPEQLDLGFDFLEKP